LAAKLYTGFIGISEGLEINAKGKREGKGRRMGMDWCRLPASTGMVDAQGMKMKSRKVPGKKDNRGGNGFAV